jgi:uncharacterized lipoprotein YmbA
MPATRPFAAGTPAPAALSGTRPGRVTRRQLLALAGAVALGGCAMAPPAPLRLLHLPATPSGAAETAAPPAPAATAAGPRWQLMSPVAVPDYLDRDTLLRADGATGLRALPGVRWAEPLRDAVPRVLRDDLARLLGEGQIWSAPLPPGLQPTHQLRVAVLALHARSDGHVLLAARWTLSATDGRSAPHSQRVELLSAPGSAADDADALALAHRQLLWRLAQAIAAADG